MSPPFCRQTAEALRYCIRLLFPSGSQIKHFLTMLKDIQDSSPRKSSACNFFPSLSLWREFILRHFTNDTCKCRVIHIHNLRFQFNSSAMKFAFYAGQSGKGDGESIQIFTLSKRKCTQTETEICWTLIFQQVKQLGDRHMWLVLEISVAGRHLDGFHTKASSGIFLPLSSSLKCSHMYEVWPPVWGSTDIWRNRGHWELNRSKRNQSMDSWFPSFQQ